MGIEDIQISGELETNAPSIKYRGNEGPKSPQEEQMIMLIQKLMSQGMGQEEAMQMAQQMMAEAEQQQMAQQQMAPQGMPPRQMAAFGGIMGLDGRRKYGWGSKLKKKIRNIIPNELADIAVKAAPFVAPFNPIAAGLMSGIGGFDQHGSISRGLKSGLMNYGMGQLARGIGGGTGNLQTGFNPAGGFGDATRMGTGFGKYFSNPMQASGGIGGYLSDKAAASGQLAKDTALRTSDAFNKIPGGGDPAIFNQNYMGDTIAKNPLSKAFSKISEYIPKSLGELNPLGENFDIKKLIGAGGILTLGTKLLGGGPEETIDEIMDRGEGLDIADIRAEVTEAFKDSSGQKLAALRSKYPYLGTQASKNTAIMADGGRIRRAEGGLMDLGGMEKDYRAEGGFVPIGEYEKKDDVPARLSVNEFVFTADAVRGAGQGDIDKGAEIMENVMKNLEQGGQMSEESQGMQGARDMFQTSQRLGEVV